jgi:hypothetical protein
MIRVQCIFAWLFLAGAAFGQQGDQRDFVGTGDLPKEVRAVLASIKPGMSRAAVERLCHEDGGLGTPFFEERYVVSGYEVGHNVLKIDLQFRPVGAPDDVYEDHRRFFAWCAQPPQKSRPSATDVVVSASRPYLEFPAYD